MRGSVTLAETYAAALEQTGSCIFWADTALNNFVSIGAAVLEQMLQMLLLKHQHRLHLYMSELTNPLENGIRMVF